MHVLIDQQKSLKVDPVWMRDEEGEAVLVVSASDAAEILETWVGLGRRHRGYRWGRDASDEEPSKIIIAESRGLGTLEMTEIDPHFDGLGEVNAYAIDHLWNAFRGGLGWGEDIGEDDVPALPDWAIEHNEGTGL